MHVAALGCSYTRARAPQGDFDRKTIRSFTSLIMFISAYSSSSACNEIVWLCHCPKHSLFFLQHGYYITFCPFCNNHLCTCPLFKPLFGPCWPISCRPSMTPTWPKCIYIQGSAVKHGVQTICCPAHCMHAHLHKLRICGPLCHSWAGSSSNCHNIMTQHGGFIQSNINNHILLLVDVRHHMGLSQRMRMQVLRTE